VSLGAEQVLGGLVGQRERFVDVGERLRELTDRGSSPGLSTTVPPRPSQTTSPR
jgi:hypothetical protein